MAKKVFIDGEAGTTGLQVRDRLSGRDDIEIISPPSELRKDEETRKKFINEADAVILCLPDEASIEAASWVEEGNDRTVIIDASTAFRVDENWTYGFPVSNVIFVFSHSIFVHLDLSIILTLNLHNFRNYPRNNGKL
jgi:N-acetyl-gamma-glutamyl-phosphate reductase